MSVKTRKSCGCGRNHTVLAVMSLLAGAAACASHDKSAAPSSADESAPQFALTVSGLPACGSSRDGQIYFVSSDSNFYVCRSSGSTWAWVQTNLNGFNGASRVTTVSPGSQCASGGYSIQFGLDQNRNGTLDTTEASSTTVVCNGSTGLQGAQGPQGATGATGATGQSGLQSLIATTPEPAGANCANGGVAVKSGLDLNRDGTLQPAEVQNTSFVCNGTSGGCGTGSHDNGSGTCVPTGCPTGSHNGGDGICVPAGACSEAYHNDGLGGCLQEGCALGFHDGGGICVAEGICATGWHDNGEGICVHSGCSFGFHDNGAGTCVQTGCFAGYHNGGDGTCVAPGTCVEGYHNDGTGACVQVGCALGFHDGGGTCVANICVPGTPGCLLKPNGQSCAAASECNSGFCADGVCCNQACTGCLACTNDLTGQASGQCLPVMAGRTTPYNPCPASTGQPCGFDGTCDGAGSCRYPVSGTSCAAPLCTGSILTTSACNAAHACVPMSTPCTSGFCASSTSCGTQKPQGAACASPSECNSGFCADGVCCDRACTGSCQACDLATSPGTCTMLAANASPHASHPACLGSTDPCGGKCSGASAACSYPASSTMCGTASCNGNNYQAAGSCNGVGSCAVPAVQACTYRCVLPSGCTGS